MSQAPVLPPFKIDTCRGNQNCSYAVLSAQELLLSLQEILERRLEGHNVSSHHSMLRFSLSCCPNSCSQPQVRDFGLQGRQKPVITDHPCIHCQACVKACPEKYVHLLDQGPHFSEHCLACGRCIEVCPTGTLEEGKSGWSLLVGGKLGRQPAFAIPVGHYLSHDEVIQNILALLEPYLTATMNEGPSSQERFRAWLDRNSVLTKEAPPLLSPLSSHNRSTEKK
ncbi:4Fe-4S binding protein [Heliorestis convoluta]|uniref:4Fe-4S dicluster domain-containing protein n=1 Tax=Heliorestis convoluta TaxID=356322 RepID=A0A5Q2N8V9_9FIRM|nr:4Fe-4S binding protein [Heliorestis convoluta]QGG48690.1 4Fe-4S dicluster domain-containing protein [Heliorestis convoluta]